MLFRRPRGAWSDRSRRPGSRRLAVALFFIGATWTLVFALYRTGKLWMGDRSPEATTPILYLPTVAGSLVTASGAAALGHADWGPLAFGAGVFGWFAIESVLVHRCLYTSPAVAAGAYLNVCLGFVAGNLVIAAIAVTTLRLAFSGKLLPAGVPVDPVAVVASPA